ncbi:C4b-binding protein alpha chain-like [Osmerus mordax]|uniref:C4b-binding protein alpha chain-like n=1 Tax=Osmerus mordax TaxID=8014 RepID=UPI00350ED7E3
MPNSNGIPGLCIFSVAILLTFVPDAVQAQCSRPTGENMHLKEEYLSQTSFPDGSKAMFACDTGYRGAGPLSVVCLGDSWTPIQEGCKKVACGAPGEVANGWYDIREGTDFGSVAQAHCHEGHRLLGMGRRVCKSAGWSNRVAVCEVVQCGPPPQIHSGVILDEKESYSYGAVARYRCHGDLTLNGSRTLHCDKTGQFYPNPPTCIDVTCPDPVVENAYLIERSMPPFKYRSYVTFKCLRGYKLNGSNSLTCQIDSVWSKSLPACVKDDSSVEPDEPEKKLSYFNKFRSFMKNFYEKVKSELNEVELGWFD